MYILHYTPNFKRRIYKLKRNNRSLEKKIIKTLEDLNSNPFNIRIKTHKVITEYGDTFSSRVNKDIRILWIFKKSEQIIILLSIGGHEGSKKVYR